MKFIGQSKIRNELGFLMDDFKQDNNYSILLSAPSGMGKTTLGYLFLAHSNSSYHIVIPNEEFVSLDLSKRIQMVDEVHLLRNPEILYPLMDSREHSFVFTTNEIYSLKEPLVNRCIAFTFEQYNNSELLEMVNFFSEKKLPENIVQYVADISGGIPRILKNLCIRLNYITRYMVNPNYMNIISEVMNIRDGLTELERRYIDFINRAGGKASIDSITNGTRLEKAFVLREIEPRLVYLGLVKITSKGRELCL